MSNLLGNWKDLINAASRMGTRSSARLKILQLKKDLKTICLKLRFIFKNLAEAMWDAHNESEPSF